MKKTMFTRGMMHMAAFVAVGMLFYSCNKEELRPISSTDTIPEVIVDTIPESYFAAWVCEEPWDKKYRITCYQLEDSVIFTRVTKDDSSLRLCFENGYFYKYRVQTPEDFPEMVLYDEDRVVTFTECWPLGSDKVNRLDASFVASDITDSSVRLCQMWVLDDPDLVGEYLFFKTTR